MKRLLIWTPVVLVLVAVLGTALAYHEGNTRARVVVCTLLPTEACVAFLQHRKELATTVRQDELQDLPSVVNMVERLHQVSAFDRVAPVEVWQNRRHALSLRGRFDANWKARGVSLWTVGLVQRGDYDTAIDVASAHFNWDPAQPQSNLHYAGNLYLGLAYLLRNGSVNCIDKAPADQCSIPLPVATDPQELSDLQKAYDVLNAVARRDRADSTFHGAALYLLNLTKMRAGDAVPDLPQGAEAFARAFSPKSDFPKFEDIADAVGITRITNAGTAIFEDFDGDGLLDAVISSRQEGENIAFFRNTGSGFEDRSAASGLGATQGAIIIKQVDFDNDGDVDLYIPRGDWGPKTIDYPVSLMANDGTGVFTDATVQSGLSVFGRAQGNDWADYDRDGDLDLVVSYEFNPDVAITLHRNDGADGFTDLALPQPYRRTNERIKTVIWGDFDNDGWEDVYTAAFTGERFILRNRGEDASGSHAGFELWPDALPPTESERVAQKLTNYAAWVWDINNDGWLDIMQLSLNNPPNRMQLALNNHYAPDAGLPTLAVFINEQGQGFRDAALEMGLRQALPAMGANFGDINADGWLDFYVGTGNVPQYMLNPNMMFVNDGGTRFRDVTIEGGFGNIQKGHGSSFADFDQDGDIDILSQFGGEFQADRGRAALYQNPGNDNRIVILRLRGVQSNSFGVGARVRLTLDLPDGETRELHHRVGTGATFGSNPLQLQVGVGQADTIARIEVDWPSGSETQVIEGPIEPARIYMLREDTDVLEEVTRL